MATNKSERQIATMVTMLAALSLTACGGGSSSSIGGGNSGADKTSSIVVQLSPNLAMQRVPRQQPERVTRIATILSDLLIRNALAQTAGVKVFVDGFEVGETDSDGNFAVAVAAGPHTVCIDDPIDPLKCMDVDVGTDEVVVISNVDLDLDGNLVSGTITTESAFDNIVLFEDPNKSQKTLVCHKGRTISVGTPAALTGHKVHGDIPGECLGAEPIAEVDDDMGDEDPDQSTGDDGVKVTICHKTGAGSKTITVADPAVNTHLGHGDTIGAC